MRTHSRPSEYLTEAREHTRHNTTLCPLTLISKVREIVMYNCLCSTEDEVFADAAPKVVVGIPTHLRRQGEAIVVALAVRTSRESK